MAVIDLHRRIARQEERHQSPQDSDEMPAASAWIKHFTPAMKAFTDAAFAGQRQCSVAERCAWIFSLPDAPAQHSLLECRDFESVARGAYGEGWQVEMDAKAADAAAHCQTAYGPDWADMFEAIWRGDNGPLFDPLQAQLPDLTHLMEEICHISPERQVDKCSDESPPSFTVVGTHSSILSAPA